MTSAANDNTKQMRKNFFGRMLHNFVENRRASRKMREMLNLGDHILRDIGLSRHDINGCLNIGGKSGTQYLLNIAEENRREQVRLMREALTIRRVTTDQVKIAA